MKTIPDVQALQRRFGVEPVRAKGDDGIGVDLDDFEKQLKTRCPRLVAFTHVPTNSGLVQPVATLGHLVKKYSDAVYLVDACLDTYRRNANDPSLLLPARYPERHLTQRL